MSPAQPDTTYNPHHLMVRTVDLQMDADSTGDFPESIHMDVSEGFGGLAHDGIAQQLSDLARDLQGESSTGQILDHIVQAAIRLIPHAAEASISLVKARRTVESHAASSELPRAVDAVQTETRQGPCVDAAYKESIVRVPDMSDESRWPRFAHRAWDLGARSMLAFQLFVEGENLGALNIYGDNVNVFDTDSEQIGLLVASHAAIAFSDSQEIRHLNSALVNRDLIGQAKGILMERHKISAQQAFTLLRTVSANTNTKLIDVVEQLTDSGELATARTRH